MPELPDLVAIKRYFDSTSLHRRIGSVEVGRTYVLGDLPPERLISTLQGREFLRTVRHGKNLLAETDDERWLRLHFGMTGHLRYFKDPNEQPVHARVVFVFENGYRLAYICQRMLGHVSLEKGPEQFIEREGLGPDALRMNADRFREIFRERRGMLKSTLMNQSVIAGLGNVYADEALFQARMHPRATFDQLAEDGLDILYHAIQDVLRTAVDRGSDARDLPETYLVHRRGQDEPCPRCTSSIRRTKVNQRSTYFCPRCQKKPNTA